MSDESAITATGPRQGLSLVTWIAALLLLAAVPLLLSASGQQDHQGSFAEPVDDRETLDRYRYGEQRRSVCGVHSVFLFCHLLGATPALTEVEDMLGLDPSGHSLLELLSAIRALGGRADLRRRILHQDAGVIELPCIVYTPRKSRRGDSVVGHFFIVSDIERGTVTYIEPITGKVMNEPLTRFAERVHGPVIESGSNQARLSGTVILLAGLLSGALLLGLFRLAREHLARRVAPAGLLLVLLCPPLDALNSDLRRAVGEDGVNTAYLLMGMTARSGDERPSYKGLRES